MTISCGHTFGKATLVQYLQRASANRPGSSGEASLCPECREPIRESIERLQVNRLLQRTIGRLCGQKLEALALEEVGKMRGLEPLAVGRLNELLDRYPDNPRIARCVAHSIRMVHEEEGKAGLVEPADNGSAAVSYCRRHVTTTCEAYELMVVPDHSFKPVTILCVISYLQGGAGGAAALGRGGLGGGRADRPPPQASPRADTATHARLPSPTARPRQPNRRGAGAVVGDPGRVSDPGRAGGSVGRRGEAAGSGLHRLTVLHLPQGHAATRADRR